MLSDPRLCMRAAHAVSAELIPRMPIPANALTKHNFLLCVRSRLSPNNCKLTIAMMPAVIANMHPYTFSPGSPTPSSFPRPATLNHSAATPAPRGWETPPRSADQNIAFQREFMAR